MNSVILCKTIPYHWLYQHHLLTGVKLKDYLDQRSQLPTTYKFSKNTTKLDLDSAHHPTQNKNITQLKVKGKKVKSHNYSAKEARRIETNSTKAANS